ncbi:adenylate/guanylate cyclase domain-containing response regulator [Thiospirochaeta perfilievii]|uniref:Adenylate/guanylate cyclase domain-containing response regulator n=1 Tax=Thiospirochaeta perfilievii TaxID=252967 RepID=A0A5C1Q9D0_9SPIO|nr:adenylate/guanylate cyclase domain-containing protein [Thiospirochaeta perfilievii]QEN03958.1 adenylate/guanylate cyclase domain-containing response regulator [Thiospirochaeta perfilievii]
MEKSRILIVDDVEENLKVLTETLTQQGFHPLQAKSGERAIQIAKKAKPDLILLDIQMPGMDGFETISILKNDLETVDIPVIFISALNQIEDKVKGFKSGAVDYVSKPFQKEEVIARVTTHLKLRTALKDIEVEREKSEKLLQNVLPLSVANELKETGVSLPQNFKDVSVLFSDIVNFTKYSGELDPITLISELNTMFTKFDDIMENNGCERIKTIGDAYLGICGVPNHTSNHAYKISKAATQMINYIEDYNKSSEYKWEVRIGIHSGDIVGGIVGKKKYIYDIFGDTVNIASRMESNSKPMCINISEDTFNRVKDSFNCNKREPLEVKGKGLTNMYFIESFKG